MKTALRRSLIALPLLATIAFSTVAPSVAQAIDRPSKKDHAIAAGLILTSLATMKYISLEGGYLMLLTGGGYSLKNTAQMIGHDLEGWYKNRNKKKENRSSPKGKPTKPQKPGKFRI